MKKKKILRAISVGCLWLCVYINYGRMTFSSDNYLLARSYERGCCCINNRRIYIRTFSTTPSDRICILYAHAHACLFLDVKKTRDVTREPKEKEAIVLLLTSHAKPKKALSTYTLLIKKLSKNFLFFFLCSLARFLYTRYPN